MAPMVSKMLLRRFIHPVREVDWLSPSVTARLRQPNEEGWLHHALHCAHYGNLSVGAYVTIKAADDHGEAGKSNLRS